MAKRKMRLFRIITIIMAYLWAVLCIIHGAQTELIQGQGSNLWLYLNEVMRSGGWIFLIFATISALFDILGGFIFLLFSLPFLYEIAFDNAYIELSDLLFLTPYLILPLTLAGMLFYYAYKVRKERLIQPWINPPVSVLKRVLLLGKILGLIWGVFWAIIGIESLIDEKLWTSFLGLPLFYASCTYPVWIFFLPLAILACFFETVAWVFIFVSLIYIYSRTPILSDLNVVEYWWLFFLPLISVFLVIYSTRNLRKRVRESRNASQ
jgi:hypothetical protein